MKVLISCPNFVPLILERVGGGAELFHWVFFLEWFLITHKSKKK
ncbi:hypothetical protein AsAng_0015900 [Aureispira anguillae]|uniref:Uncharacterized protein n=1 Tax=Aureispira anguillae TaxID=2864201 RepID=A0A915YD39_9BACT|nr:hypothetical protein AsAng_0015900 [Aureispira anguillae]